ncbi:cytochrome P450 [Tuber borchii]|uniref:Cytochrome P450 n=1 Tax=Tuber borchii TaxID=42251 RepID=A0A2T7A180_TUBBO|nr:cytochrome P450 [Tuber borchii]
MLIIYTVTEWRSIEIFTPIRRMVAHTSSRVFVGLPLCRNEDWLTISMRYTSEFLMTVDKLRSIPKLIRPFYAWMFNSTKLIKSNRKKAQTLLGPIIQRRLEEERLAKEIGSVYKKPNDMLQWLTDLIEPRHKTIEDLSELQLLAILASIHTSLSFLNALCNLAANQECVQPIREEIEAVISANNGVVDSRKILKSVTLSDGTRLPQGTRVSAPSAMFSSDPDLLEDPETFDGFRWYKKSLEAEGSAVYNTNLATTSTRDLGLGHGKHACPGRFFATEEMKILLIFIILQYDFLVSKTDAPKVTASIGKYQTATGTSAGT